VPDFILFLVRQAAIGFVISALFTGGLLWADLGGLGSLVTASPTGIFGGFLLWLFTGLTFASVQMGAAIMLLGHAPPPDSVSRRAPPCAGLVPVPAGRVKRGR
jgi:hypothetical protein